MKLEVTAIWPVALAVGLLFMSATADSLDQSGVPADNPKSVIGPRNPLLAEGADALRDGDYEKGVELTRKGLAVARGRREHKTALSNLCAGYFMLGRLQAALDACNEAVALDPEFWRGYNNRALVLMELGRYEESAADVDKGLALQPQAKKLQLTRARLLDATNPVETSIEVDDRRNAATTDAER